MIYLSTYLSIFLSRAVRELFLEQLRVIDSHPYENVGDDGRPLAADGEAVIPDYETIFVKGRAIYLSICLSIYPSIHLSFYLSIYLSIFLSISIYLSIYPSINLSIYGGHLPAIYSINPDCSFYVLLFRGP